MSKRFNESGNTAVFTTKFVLNDGKEITTVYHYEEDGAWQFSSSDEFEDFEEVARIVKIDEIVKLDNTLLDVADLPEGFMAFRNSKIDKWEIKKIQISH
jgi:hypothetical protein